MPLQVTQTLRPNGGGGQVYIPADVVADSAFPFDRGEECIVQTIPNNAVLLLPGDREPEFPLTFNDPHRIANQPTNPDSL